MRIVAVADTHLYHRDLIVPAGDVFVHAAKWAKIAGDTQVLITHGPPAGFGDRSWSKARTGCVDLRR